MANPYSLTIWLTGRFRLTDACGQIIPISSAKGQALLALLATGRGCDRGRLWLQDKLWSDRDPESGARSLRQELSQLRRQLGPHADVLITDRHAVRLDRDRVSVIDEATEAGEEFLEGLDVRDPEFNAWLVSERTRRLPDDVAAKAAAPYSLATSGTPDVTVMIVTTADSDPTSRVVEAQILDRTAQGLSDFCAVRTNPVLAGTVPSAQLLLSIHLIRDASGMFAVRAILEDIATRRTHWTETTPKVEITDTIEVPWALLAVTNKIVAETTRYIAQRPLHGKRDLSAATLASRAIHGIFSIKDNELVTADRLLQDAYSIDSRGVFKAWRIQLLVIQYVERFCADRQALFDQGDQLCAEAIAEEPLNSNVLAAVANFKTIMERNVVAGIELARLGIRSNSANPLAWWALSNALQYTGNVQETYITAQRAHHLAQGTRLEFWTAFQRSLSAALVRKAGEAIAFGELASSLSPTFAPPLRYLLALYAKTGQAGSAQRVLQSLQCREADFSLDRLLNDPDYPISIARSSGILDPALLAVCEAGSSQVACAQGSRTRALNGAADG